MNKIFKIILVLFLGLALLLLRTISDINAIDEPFASWVNEESLPYTIASHQSEVYNDHLYVFGGAGRTDGKDVFHSEIQASKINQDGSLLGWKSVSDMPEELIYHNIVKNNNQIYLLGGVKLDPDLKHVSSTDKVYVSSIDTHGNISSWKEIEPLPKELALGSAFIYKDWIYYIGGFSRITSGDFYYHSGVYAARIKDDGTIDNWKILTPLPEARSSFASFVVNDYVFVVGGQLSESNLATDTVLRNSIDPANGEIDSWEELDPLLEPSYRPGYFVKDDTIFLLGGSNGSSYSNSIFYSSVNNDGFLNWIKSTSTLPRPNGCFPASISNQHLYITGGHDGNYYFSETRRTSLISGTEVLNVPDLKQYDSPWGNEVYDHADVWSPTEATIERWGCGLTSATMVLQYHGFPINPDGLNDWLNDEPDGYIRNGLLNWLAVSRYTYKNTTGDSPTLEFRRYDASSTTLEEKLNAERPPILGLSGHFVVAKGKQNSDFSVNDPDSTIDSLSLVETAREAEYSSIYSYLPSNTDLSYIMLVVDSGITLTVYDSGGNEVGDFYPDEFLKDDVGGGENEHLNIFLLPTPGDGVYRVEATGPAGSYQLDSYLYNEQGEVQTFSSERTIAGEDQKDEFLITIDGVIDTPDTTSPVVGITSPVNNTILRGLVDIVGSVSDDVKLSHYNLSLYPGTTDLSDGNTHSGERLNNSNWCTIPISGTVSLTDDFSGNLCTDWNTTQYVDGEYQIRLAARDAAGNRDTSDPDTGGTSSVHIIGITIDNTAPVVEITSHDDGDLVSGVVEVRGSVSDNNPHHYYAVLRNSSNSDVAGAGVVNRYDSFTDEVLFTFDSTILIEGETYTIWLAARDAAGNQDISDPYNGNTSSVHVIRITIDNTRPLITWVTPEHGDTYAGVIPLRAKCDEICDYVNFWWRHENEVFSSFSKRYHYVHDDGTMFEWELDSMNAVKWDSSTYVMEDGVYYLYAAGKDLVGNWAKTPEIMIIVNNTPDNKDQCKNGGWMSFYKPSFKNQGTCVSYLESNKHAGKRDLRKVIREIRAFTPRFIDLEASQILQDDLLILLEALQ